MILEFCFHRVSSGNKHLAATVWDRAGNFKSYNFVEYVRFDVIESEIVLTSPLEVEILEEHINAKMLIVFLQKCLVFHERS